MSLSRKHSIVLVEDLYEDLELWCPLLRLREAGGRVSVVGPKAKAIHTSRTCAI
jgi:protease I